jgi:hypothetical protein
MTAFAVVPDGLVEEGLKADEWVRATVERCDGGRSSMKAKGEAKQCSNVEAVVRAANTFAESKLGSAVS